MDLALQTTGTLSASVFRPRTPKPSGFTLGSLTIIAALSVVYIATQSPVYVQLFTATAGGLLGMLAVRNRYSPKVASDCFPVGHTKGFQDETDCLAVIGNALLQETRQRNQPMGIVVFDFSDLPELQIVYKGQVPRDLGPTIEDKLRSLTPAKGAVVRTRATTFTVLLPNFDTHRTVRAVSDAFGKGCCLEFAEGDSEMLLLPDYVIRTVREGTESVEDVYRVLYAELLEAQRLTERRHTYLRQERESHTRTTSPLSSDTQIKAKLRRLNVVPMTATMPVALQV